jgi:hypothetical protein
VCLSEFYCEAYPMSNVDSKQFRDLKDSLKDRGAENESGRAHDSEGQ